MSLELLSEQHLLSDLYRAEVTVSEEEEAELLEFTSSEDTSENTDTSMEVDSVSSNLFCWN